MGERRTVPEDRKSIGNPLMKDEAYNYGVVDALEKMIKPGQPMPSVADLKQEIFNCTVNYFEFFGLKPSPKTLSNHQIAVAISKLFHIIRVEAPGNSAENSGILAVYQDSGPREGTYSTDPAVLYRLIKQFNFEANTNDAKDIEYELQSLCESRTQETDRDMVPVGNGIFNYKTKTLEPFSPEHVFLSKAAVNFNPSASTSPVIHNDDDGTDWDVDTWMDELSDDPEVVDLLWHIIGACVRPHVSFDKMALFYSSRGNNGKGTLLTMMKAMLGAGNYASITIKDLSKEFATTELSHVCCVLTDENSVGGYVDEAHILKAIITGDTFSLKRKYKDPVTMQFHGFCVQCINELPKFKDRSDSVLRRFLIIPFEKCFTGHERKYIKHDYLTRPEVLEYVLYKVLMLIPDYYELPTPAVCRAALNEFRLDNDPVAAFIEEMFPALAWDVVSFRFLYDLYRAWLEKTNPNGRPLGERNFVRELIDKMETVGNPIFEYPGKTADGAHKKLMVGNGMTRPEPLIAEYDLKSWCNPTYSGPSVEKRCMTYFNPDDRVKGIKRCGTDYPYVAYSPAIVA